jgi:hypothetical protein
VPALVEAVRQHGGSSGAAVQQLQAQLAETEDRIAAARRVHASDVRELRVRLDTFPGGLLARALGVERPDDGEPDDREQAELEVPPRTAGDDG